MYYSTLKNSFYTSFNSQANFFNRCLFVFVLLTGIAGSEESVDIITDQAQRLTSQFKNSIVQIRVIENKTNKKSSIGSGFFISQSGLIASNYHVIASVVQNPERYHLEYVDYQGNTGEVAIVQVDVVHDLAIVKSDFKPEIFLSLAKESVKQGAKLFSFGNPHDLGLTVVEGTNNGLLENTRNEKIHFSGSLNPGMSGGPTLNRLGEVVGINVSTAGNQISFLVPAKFLKNLFDSGMSQPDLVKSQFDQQIENQLLSDQKVFLSRLLSRKWSKESIGNIILPTDLGSEFKCWGDSNKKEDRLVDSSLTQCSTDDNVFIDSAFSTGNISYSYRHIMNRELNQVHFYELYSSYSRIVANNNFGNEEYVTNYQCHSDFVLIESKHWRTHTCVRRYKKYAKLYDLIMNTVLVSEKDQGMIVTLSAAAVSQPMGTQFTKRFLQEISWQN